MIQKEELNFSRQLIKQDKELSQFLSYLEQQRSFAHKNKEREAKLQGKFYEIEAKREEKNRENQVKAELKKLELSRIRQKYENTIKQRKQNLQDKYEYHQMISEQLREESNLIRQEKSMIKSLMTDETIKRAQQLSQSIQLKKKQNLEEKQKKNDDILSQLISTKEMDRQFKSVEFQLKQNMSHQNYLNSQQLHNQRIENMKSRLDLKDIISKEIQSEQQRRIDEKLMREKVRYEQGLDGVKRANEYHQQRLADQQSKTEYKLQRLDQMMRDKQILQEKEREGQALMEKKKHLLRQQFLKDMDSLDKYNNKY